MGGPGDTVAPNSKRSMTSYGKTNSPLKQGSRDNVVLVGDTANRATRGSCVVPRRHQAGGSGEPMLNWFGQSTCPSSAHHLDTRVLSSETTGKTLPIHCQTFPRYYGRDRTRHVRWQPKELLPQASIFLVVSKPSQAHTLHLHVKITRR